MEEGRKQGSLTIAPSPSPDPWLTLNTVVERTGKGRQTVMMAALTGRIRYQCVAGRLFIHRDDLPALETAALGEED